MRRDDKTGAQSWREWQPTLKKRELGRLGEVRTTVLWADEGRMERSSFRGWKRFPVNERVPQVCGSSATQRYALYLYITSRQSDCFLREDPGRSMGSRAGPLDAKGGGGQWARLEQRLCVLSLFGADLTQPSPFVLQVHRAGNWNNDSCGKESELRARETKDRGGGKWKM